MATSSYCVLQYEESPRYEDAPTTTPYRVSIVNHYYPLISGRVAAEPQLRDRNNELRGNLSPMPSLVDSLLATGSITVAAYMSKAVPLLDLSGLLMTGTQGDGANEIQTFTQSGTISGGTFDLAVEASANCTITNIPWNTTAAALQTLIDNLIRRGGSGYKLGDLVVGGGPFPGTPLTLTFQGTKSCVNCTQSTTDNTNLTGTTPDITDATSQAGSVGTVTLPDGTGLPASAYRWQSAKRTGATPQSAQVTAAYQENGVWELGQGFAATQLSMGSDGNLAATLAGLVALPAADPSLTPSYDAGSVAPMLTRDLVVSWRSGAGNVSDFTWQIDNPFQAVRNYGIRSPWPGVLRATEGFTTMTGTVNMDQYDPEDRQAFVEAGTFAAQAHWRSSSKIGSTGALYQMFVEAPACQIVGGQGAEDLSAKRNFGASYNWMAGYDESAGRDFRVTCTSGVSTQATYA